MESLPPSLQRVVRASRQAALAEAACLGMAAFFLVVMAALADGFVPFSGGPVGAAAISFAAVAAAFLRTHWRSPESALRHADRIVGGEDRWTTRYALHARRSSLGSLDALCEIETERWLERRGAPSWRGFFHSKFCVAPGIAGALLGILALSPGVAWQSANSAAGLRMEIASLAREMAREAGVEDARIASSLEAMQQSLGDARSPQSALAQMQQLHEEILRQAAQPSLPTRTAELTQRALEILEKGMIAVSKSQDAQTAGTIAEGTKVASGSGDGHGENRSMPAPERSSGTGFSEVPGSTRVSAAYEIPPRFDPVVRRYFASASEEHR